MGEYSESSEDNSQTQPQTLDSNGNEQPSTVVTASEDDQEPAVEDPDQTEATPFQMGKRGWIISGTIAALFAGAVGWRVWTMIQMAQGPFPPGGGPPGVAVEVAPVASGMLTQSSNYVASLESRRSVSLQPQTEGRVTQIFVNEGDVVNEGAPILQVDADQQAATVSGAAAAADSAQATVANERATLKSLEAQRLSVLSNLRYSRRQYERFSQLYSEGAVSQQQRDEQLDNLQVAQANLGQINQQLEAQEARISAAVNSLAQAQSNVTEQQVELRYYRVNAPFAGTVGDIPVKIGDYVTPSTMLANLTQNQSLLVNISIPIERAADLQLGLPVELINAQGQRIGSSRISFISPTVNNDTQSVLVKAGFNNAADRLRAEQFLQAKVIWNQRPGPLVPTTAISRIAGQDFVFVAEKQENQTIARQRPVKLGDIQNNQYQVLQGLRPGETLVTAGIQKLQDGAPIMPKTGDGSGS